MFAIDGCKISSNCAKEWSGTKAELVKKADKIERSTMAGRITAWLAEHEDRIGTRGTPVKSNITDNESAKMVSSHGVTQGYNGIATVDEKHQVVVDGQALGDGRRDFDHRDARSTPASCADILHGRRLVSRPA